MAVRTTANMPDSVKIFYDKLLLDRLKKSLWFAQFADKRPLPRNGGDTIEFTSYDNLPVSITALIEGQRKDVDAGQALVVNKQSNKLLEFGDFVAYSGKWEMTKIDPGLEEQIDILAYQGAQSVDTIVRDTLANNADLSAVTDQFGNGGSTKFSGGCSTLKFANGRAAFDDIQPGDTLNGDEVRLARTDLKKADVQPIAGSDYVMMIHPVNASDMFGDSSVTGFVDGHKYDQPGRLFTGELGKWSGVRFIESSNINSAQNAYAGLGGPTDVYDCFLLGKHAYAMSAIGSSSVALHLSEPKTSTHDPLAQVGTIGWKAMFSVAALNPSRIIKLQVGSSVSP